MNKKQNINSYKSTFMKKTKLVYNQVNIEDAALHENLANNKEKLYQSVKANYKITGDDDFIDQEDCEYFWSKIMFKVKKMKIGTEKNKF